LPFRVWQIFTEMQKFARKKDVARFVAAAGVLAHYIGDACQPLHISYMFDGEPRTGQEKRGKGVHHAYEAVMFNTSVAELWDGIEERVSPSKEKTVQTGRDAAVRTVKLMRQTFELLEPTDIIDAYVAKKNLWQEFGDRTKQTMVNGVRVLAHLWDSAWETGSGDAIGTTTLKAIDE